MSQWHPKVAAYVTWEEFSKKPSAVAELRDLLKQLPRLQVINQCAAVNIFLRTWEGQVDLDEHERLLRSAFSEKYATDLNVLARSGTPPRFVFHRQQLLFLMKEAANCSTDSGENLQADFARVFAECCLRANDLLHYNLALNPEVPRVERLMPEMITVNDYASRDSYLRKIARTRKMLDENIKGRLPIADDGFIDLAARFSEISGLSIRQYAALTFGVMTKYMNLKVPQYLADKESFIVTKEYFKNTSVDLQRVEAFFSDNSTNLSDLKKACERTKRGNDFTPLRDRPLLEVSEGKYILLDLGFMAEKLESGVFWRVHFQALQSKQERDNLHSLWGHLFEEYVRQILDDACKDSPNRFYPHPTFAESGEAGDVLIKCGSTIIIMECKGSMLTAEAKYSGSPESLMDEIESKFVGTDENPKGIRQLARNIEKLGIKRDPEKIDGLGSIAKVFPVLVAKESALTSPFVNRYLNEKFQCMYNRKQIRPIVTPLFVLGVDELEEISGYLKDTQIDEILEAKYRNDPRQEWPFSTVPNPILDRTPSKVNKSLEKVFDGMIDETCRDFFGRPFEKL